ncbi:protein shisa-9-like [Amia ocellicauda]|uniref:protein shisa-9-like n=1 Tax=Amia ocellicauda TaxID=2972642 RepID=UPI003464AF16
MAVEGTGLGLPLGSNGISARVLRNSSDHTHLNNAAVPPLGQVMALPHPHNNLNMGGLSFNNKYSSLKAVADTVGGDFYKAYPMMDLPHPANAPPPFQTIALHPKDKPLLSQPELRIPLAVTISSAPSSKPKIAKTNTHPLASSSAFQAWDPSKGHPQARAHHVVQPASRRQAYSNKRQYSIETLPELFTQPLGYGHQLRPPTATPQPHKHKSFPTNSKTEVTV